MSFARSFSTLMYVVMRPMVKENPLSILENDRKTARRLISRKFGQKSPIGIMLGCLRGYPESRHLVGEFDDVVLLTPCIPSTTRLPALPGGLRSAGRA